MEEKRVVGYKYLKEKKINRYMYASEVLRVGSFTNYELVNV